MDICRECQAITFDTLCPQCKRKLTGPAPKEEEMKCVDCGVKCVDVPICNDCNNKRHERWTRTAERRAVAREAYMAALGGLMTLAAEVDCGVKGLVSDAEMAAIETVRRWDAFMAAVDAEGGE